MEQAAAIVRDLPHVTLVWVPRAVARRAITLSRVGGLAARLSQHLFVASPAELLFGGRPLFGQRAEEERVRFRGWRHLRERMQGRQGARVGDAAAPAAAGGAEDEDSEGVMPHLPINLLRNIAVAHATTAFVIVTDIGLLPSPSTYNLLRAARSMCVPLAASRRGPRTPHRTGIASPRGLCGARRVDWNERIALLVPAFAVDTTAAPPEMRDWPSGDVALPGSRTELQAVSMPPPLLPIARVSCVPGGSCTKHAPCRCTPAVAARTCPGCPRCGTGSLAVTPSRCSTSLARSCL